MTILITGANGAISSAVWAVRNARVSHIVRLSAIGAAHDAPNRNGRLHALSDAGLAASGIACTSSDTTTVHMKDRTSGKEAFLPFARSVLHGLNTYTG